MNLVAKLNFDQKEFKRKVLIWKIRMIQKFPVPCS